MLCLPSLHPWEQLAQGAVAAKDIPPSETNILSETNINRAWISNYIHYQVQGEIPHPFPNFCWSLGMHEELHPAFYWAYDYLSIVKFRLHHVDKRSPKGLLQYRISLPQKHILNPQKGCLSISYSSINKSFWYFAQSMAVPLLFFVKIYKMIGQLKLMFWINKFSWDLSLRLVLEYILVLKQPPRPQNCYQREVVISKKTTTESIGYWVPAKVCYCSRRQMQQEILCGIKDL